MKKVLLTSGPIVGIGVTHILSVVNTNSFRPGTG